MTDDAVFAATADRRQPGRLLAWCALAGTLAALAYIGRAVGGEPANDVLYRWATFAGALVQYALMLGVVLVISRGFDRELLALQRPPRVRRAALLAAAAFVFILATSALLGLVLDAGKEQNLVPKSWESAHAAPFIANAVVIVVVAPFVEELLYRGEGFSLFLPFVGAWPTIVIVGVSFGLAHGLIVGFPVLALFGMTLAWLRRETGSVYPGMLVHALFNGLTLLLAVAT